jgi:hypothetical protein
VLGLFAFVTALPSTAAASGTITVGGGCTLVDAVTAANTDTATGGCAAGNGADTIVLQAGAIYTFTSAASSDAILGTTALPIITSDIKIEGNGATIARDPSSATPAFRLITHTRGHLTLQRLTLRNGLTMWPVYDTYAGWGGCILSVYGPSELTIDSSTVTGCSVSGGDGAAMMLGGHPSEITNSTFDHNDSRDFVSVVRASGAGGALTFSNSTLSDNPDHLSGVGITEGAVASLTNMTIMTGSQSVVVTPGSTVGVSESILQTPSIVFGDGALTDEGHNFTGDAQLGPLQDNGGPTMTRLPLAGSPVIEAGGATCSPTDQRSVARPQGEFCDIGAVEVVDSTPPSITSNLSGTLGQNGWYTSDVATSWTLSEPESVITSQSGCDAANVTSDTSGTTLTCAATSVGGSANQSVTIKRDATPPVLNPTVSTSSISLGAVATASANASDATSGVASQSCDAVDTTSVGAHTITCAATDNAGNTNTATVTYSVGYQFDGFANPVSNDAPNVAKAGRAIPLKFRVTDSNGAPVTTVTIATITSVSLSCASGASSGEELDEYAAGASGLQNLGDGYYQINWKTPSSYAGSCRELRLNLGEGSSAIPLYHTADFQFTK